MPLKNIDMIRNKIVLLYALQNFEFEVSEDHLIEMCINLKFMNYYDFRIMLDELRDTGHVTETKRVHGVFYALTPTGENLIQAYLKELPDVNIRKIKLYCEDNAERIRQESRVMAEYFKIDDGQYRVILRTLENGITSFELSFLASTKEEAAKFAERWRQNYRNIYPEIFDSFYKFPLK